MAGTWSISTLQMVQLDSATLPHIDPCSFSLTGHSSYYGRIYFLSALAIVDPEGPVTPVAPVSSNTGSTPSVLAQNIEAGQSFDGRTRLSSASKGRCSHQRGGALRPQEDAAARSRILPVATQPCDSHWICAKSVFENAGCQKRKSRGRPHDRNRPMETETKPFFCTKLSARDPNTWEGERRCGLSIPSCILLA